MNKGLQLTLRDDRDDEDTTGESFLYEGGISEYVRFLNENKTNFYEMTIDDFMMVNYNPIKPQLKLELGIWDM